MKKLYKSDKDKVFFGVIGGLGEYFEVDSTILRLGYVLFALVTHGFPALIVYIIAAMIIPKNPHTAHVHHVHNTEHTTENK